MAVLQDFNEHIDPVKARDVTRLKIIGCQVVFLGIEVNQLDAAERDTVLWIYGPLRTNNFALRALRDRLKIFPERRSSSQKAESSLPRRPPGRKQEGGFTMFRSATSKRRGHFLLGLAAGVFLVGGGLTLMGALSPSPGFIVVPFSEGAGFPPQGTMLPSPFGYEGLTIRWLGGPGEMLAYDTDGDGLSDALFVSSGRIQIWLPEETTKLSALSLSGFQNVLVEAYACDGTWMNKVTTTGPNWWQNLFTLGLQICYVEVDGQEVFIKQIGWLVD